MKKHDYSFSISEIVYKPAFFLCNQLAAFKAPTEKIFLLDAMCFNSILSPFKKKLFIYSFFILFIYFFFIYIFFVKLLGRRLPPLCRRPWSSNVVSKISMNLFFRRSKWVHVDGLESTWCLNLRKLVLKILISLENLVALWNHVASQ